VRPAGHNHLYNRLTGKGFSPLHVAEVGVYRPETCHVYPYIVDGVRCTLVEPEPEAVALIRHDFGDRSNVSLHAVALHDRSGPLELFRCGASTYVAELTHPPAVVNDGYPERIADRFVVPATTFDTIDDGSIELLGIDVEGSEWYVIKHMVSRPGVISVETHGALYTNPHLDEILRWMTRNDYLIWYKDRTDTVFVRRGVFAVGVGERIKLVLTEIGIRLRRARKRRVRTLRAGGDG
jgi:FkbM family methyltransferase